MTSAQLEKPSILRDGFSRFPYPREKFDFVSQVQEFLAARGIIREPVALERLHERIPAEYQAVDQDGLNKVAHLFYEAEESFRELYFGLMKFLAQECFEFDFIFQETPNVRFHFPVRFVEMFRNEEGVFLGHHSDTMLGHPFEEINCWLPLTRCFGSNALQLSDLQTGLAAIRQIFEDISWDEDTYQMSGRIHFHRRLFADRSYQEFVVNNTRPVPAHLGEIIFFDPRCLHGTAENKDGVTRVSLDFRIIPVHLYEQMTKQYQSRGRSRRMLTRGDVFYSKSAREL
jgi:hypothetical protein